jgi:hypothetical protein
MFVIQRIARKQWATLIVALILALSAQWIPLKEPTSTPEMLAENNPPESAAKPPEQS